MNTQNSKQHSLADNANINSDCMIDYIVSVITSDEFNMNIDNFIKEINKIRSKSSEQTAVEEIRNKTINKLAEKSGYGIEKHDLGEGINGYIDKANNKIIVNNNSKASPILTTVHELAHGSENDSTYNDTVKQAETYLSEQGTDIGQYKQKIKDAYAKKGIELTQDGLKLEMVSKFLEENVYKSEADVMDMAFKNPSLAQKIYDSISNTVSKVGAGKAAKALLNAKANFEKALNELPNTKTASAVGEASADTQFSIANDKYDKPVVVVDSNIFSGRKTKQHGAVLKAIADQIGSSYNVVSDGEEVYLGKELPDEYTQSEYTDVLRNRSPKTLRAKNQASQHLGELIEISSKKSFEENRKAQHEKDAKFGWYKYGTRFAVPVKDAKGNILSYRVYNADLLVKHSEDGKKYLSDMMDVERDYSDNEINGIKADTQRKEDGDKSFSVDEDGGNDNDVINKNKCIIE